MKALLKRKLIFVFANIFSIIIGLCGWYVVYEKIFTDELLVKFNWNVGINHPTNSKIIIDATGGLGLEGQLYTVYSYDIEEFKKLTKKHYWKKIDEENSIILRQKVNEFTKNAIEYSRDSKKDNQLGLRVIQLNFLKKDII